MGGPLNKCPAHWFLGWRTADVKSTTQVFPVIPPGWGVTEAGFGLAVSSHQVAGVLWSLPTLLPGGRLSTVVVAAEERRPNLGPSANLAVAEGCPLGVEALALSAPRNQHCRVCVGAGGVRGNVEGEGAAGGRWASGDGGGWAPRILPPICKALYHRSGIFPTWRPNGLAWLGNPEGTVLGKGEGLPCTQQLLPEVLSTPRDSHGAAQVPRLPARQPPGLHAGLALPTPGPDGCHLSSPRAFVFSGQVDASQEGIRSLEKGGVGSWPPAPKNSRLFPISL